MKEWQAYLLRLIGWGLGLVFGLVVWLLFTSNMIFMISGAEIPTLHFEPLNEATIVFWIFLIGYALVLVYPSSFLGALVGLLLTRHKPEVVKHLVALGFVVIAYLGWIILPIVWYILALYFPVRHYPLFVQLGRVFAEGVG